jgi:hypothetical protein
VAALVLSGCGLLSPSDDERDTLEKAMRRWDAVGPTDYTYLVRRICYCVPESMGPFEVRVLQGSHDVYDPVTRDLIDPEYVDLFPPVDGLFDIIDHALREGADRLDVDYDRRTGTPIRIDIDYMEGAADDEIRYESTIPEPLWFLILSDSPSV